MFNFTAFMLQFIFLSCLYLHYFFRVIRMLFVTIVTFHTYLHAQLHETDCDAGYPLNSNEFTQIFKGDYEVKLFLSFFASFYSIKKRNVIFLCLETKLTGEILMHVKSLRDCIFNFHCTVLDIIFVLSIFFFFYSWWDIFIDYKKYKH